LKKARGNARERDENAMRTGENATERDENARERDNITPIPCINPLLHFDRLVHGQVDCDMTIVK
jgi:hypothetical protein